jgi:aspartate aminotransferase
MNIGSQLVSHLIGSEVLKIAGEINALKKTGQEILNFTVGDFDPKEFPLPPQLLKLCTEALNAGHTNYPPSSGVLELRQAVAAFLSASHRISVKSDSVLIAGGARPLIYATYLSCVDPGDTVVYPTPSWNNNHYCHLSGARGIAIDCMPQNGFLPDAKSIREFLPQARLLCLNTPLNPTGTVLPRSSLLEICESVLTENRKRKSKGQRPLFLLFDQIYWGLTKDPTSFVHPTSLFPELEEFTFSIDGLSKYFAATGLRVGWAIVPPSLMGPMSSLLGHIGAWAPKAEQVAVAQYLSHPAQAAKDMKVLWNKSQIRLEILHQGIQSLKRQGLACDSIEPQGGIYLSVQIQRKGLSDEQIRADLLRSQGVAAVPFQAFGTRSDQGWFRFSVGAVSEDACRAVVAKLQSFLKIF